MADAKLDIKAGAPSFVGEGSEAWLTQLFDKWLEAIPTLQDQSGNGDGSSDDADENGKPGPPAGSKENGAKSAPLAAYLKDTNSTTNQARKFLATAAWLQDNGRNRVQTGQVVKALHEHRQGKLTNASQCLTNNVSAGKIVKDGDRGFYVTTEGLEDLSR